MSDNDSPLSSPPPSDEEPKWNIKNGKLSLPKLTHKKARPEKIKAPAMPAPESESEIDEREEEPPHEYVLADNPDIAVLVMFRNRFAEAFPKSCVNLGPQDIESGIVDTHPSDMVEQLLCALLTLVLNRQKPVERGHHGRALEDAISSQRPQWPVAWQGKNPLSGNRTFADLGPADRLIMLKALMLWALNTSLVIKDMIAVAYKQTRKNDDLNQPMAVQPWGTDGKKRRYWLIEGHNDTSFRIYRESERKRVKNTWWSVAGTIEEAVKLAHVLDEEDKSQPARRLASGIRMAIPRLEEQERKRQRKQYRLDRRTAFTRPEPGVSMYEGRTRGNRVRYNYDDDEIYGSEGSARRSNRQSTNGTPVVEGPTYTASGRQVRSRFGKTYGDAGSADSRNTSPFNELDSASTGRGNRATRSGRAGASQANERSSRRRIADESDEDMEDVDAWDGDDQDVTGVNDTNDLSEPSDDEMADDEEDKSLVVKLRVKTPSDGLQPPASDGPTAPAAAAPAGDMKVDDIASSPPLAPATDETVQPAVPSTEGRSALNSSVQQHAVQAAPKVEHDEHKPVVLIPAYQSVSISATGPPQGHS